MTETTFRLAECRAGLQGQITEQNKTGMSRTAFS